MLVCADVMTAMYPFLDGELGGDAADRVLAHLKNCQVCRGAFAQEQTFLDLLKTHLSPIPD